MVEREHIARRDRSCPATKRNGEVCGSSIVSASGYCFAHDPEAAEWRAKGALATSRKARRAKRLKEVGVGHLVKTMEDGIKGLRSGEVSASDLRAMARATDTIFRMVKWVDEDVKEAEPEFDWSSAWDV